MKPMKPMKREMSLLLSFEVTVTFIKLNYFFCFKMIAYALSNKYYYRSSFSRNGVYQQY